MWYLYIAAFSVGITNTIMAGCNGILGKKLTSPVVALTINYGLGFVLSGAIVAVALLFKFDSLPSSSAVRSVPWWGWIGGALGATYIAAGIIIPGKIGAGSFTGMTVTAAITTSILMDHFGLLGFEQHSAGFARILGAALMFVGLFLVAKF